MELRRFTMANPTAAFSIIAHEAWDHKITDGENDDSLSVEDGHVNRQRSRRRLKVSTRYFSFAVTDSIA
jgi:hypothetical protein